jgi:hypothetical protein
MTSRLLIALTILINSSCGLLGLYTDKTNYDPDYQATAIAELNNRPIALGLDSLIREIDSASQVTPNDIANTTLIVETYKYSEYLKIFSNKFHIMQDDKKIRRVFKRYELKKQKLIKDPICKLVYVDKGEYNDFEFNNFRYVLRTTNRLQYNPENIIVRSDGHVYPFVSKFVYYIYDRRTKKIHGEIKDLKTLSRTNK